MISSMVIDNLDRVRIPVFPFEADAPAVVDSNTVLSQSIAGQRLEMISWDHSEIRQRSRGVQMIQLSLRHDIEAGKLSCVLTME
jgi:hypothetical protein